MKARPTIEEVKEYFKNADKIESLQGRKFSNVYDFGYASIRSDNMSIYAKHGSYEVWNSCQGYAKIISYKEETYQITKEQILTIANKCTSNKYAMEQAFPSIFKEDKKELVLPVDFTGWIKSTIQIDHKWMLYVENGTLIYGFDSCGDWFKPTLKQGINPTDRKATPQEIQQALENEARKRGFKRDVIINDLYNGTTEKNTTRVSNNFFEWEEVPRGKYSNQMALRDSDGNILFTGGKWAEIIQPKQMTKQQIEKELGYEISII